MSASLNSRAMAEGGASTRCAAWVRCSALSSTFGAHSVSDNRSQPDSSPAPAAASVLRRKRRRLFINFMRALLFRFVVVDRVAAGDDRTQFIAEAGDHRFEDV